MGDEAKASAEAAQKGAVSRLAGVLEDAAALFGLGAKIVADASGLLLSKEGREELVRDAKARGEAAAKKK